MDTNRMMFEFIVSLIITGIAYTAFPIIYRLVIKKKPVPRRHARIICIISAVVVYLVFVFYRAYKGVEGGGSLYPAVIWSGIAYFIIREKSEFTKPESAVQIHTEERDSNEFIEKTEEKDQSSKTIESPVQAKASIETSSEAPINMIEHKPFFLWEIRGWIKRRSKVLVPIVLTLMTVIILVLGIGYFRLKIAYEPLQKKLDSLDTIIETKNKEISGLKKNNEKLEGYKAAVKDFYIYGTVIVLENNNKYYHRYNCPDTNMSQGEFRYLAFNENQAKAAGYSKCPTCFGYTDDDYCEKYIEKR